MLFEVNITTSMLQDPQNAAFGLEPSEEARGRHETHAGRSPGACAELQMILIGGQLLSPDSCRRSQCQRSRRSDRVGIALEQPGSTT